MNFYKKNHFQSTLLTLILVTSSCSAVSINEIKGTYTILGDEFKHCSPVHGAVWWESGLIRNYYDYGAFTPQLDKSENPIKDEQGNWKWKDNGTFKLINRLFHKNPAGGFNITMGGTGIAQFFTPKTIGQIIGVLEQYRLEKPIKKPAEKRVRTYLSPKILDECLYLLPEITQIEKGQDKAKAFFDDLFNALDESGFFGATCQQISALPFAPYAMLLGFLYRKTDDKAALKEYFDALQETLGVEIQLLKGALDDAWLQSKYTEELPLQKLLQDLQPTDDLTQHYENLVYAKFSTRSPLPKNIQYTNVFFEGQKFANCADLMMRNLCNTYLYNQDSDSFIIPQELEPTADPALITFYQNHTQNAYSESYAAHQAWSAVVENKPWIAYNRIVSNDRSLTTRAPQNSLGFIYFTQQDGQAITTQEQLAALFDGIEGISIQEATTPHSIASLVVHDRTYIVINPESYKIYEVQPSIKNIIAMLNRSLGLGLYPPELPMHQAFCSKTFNETHFPALCKKLDWEYELKTVETLSEFDEKDYTNVQIDTAILTPNGQNFEIQTSSGHGEIVFFSEKTSIGTEAFFNSLIAGIQQSSDPEQIFFKANLLNLMNNESQATLEYAFKQLTQQQSSQSPQPLKYSTPLIVYICFMHNLMILETSLQIIECLLTCKDTLLLNIALKLIYTLPQPEDIRPQRSIIQAIRKNQDITHKFFENVATEFFDRIKTNGDQYEILAFLEILVNSGFEHFYAEGIEAASAGVQGGEQHVQIAALALFKTLVEKGQGFSEAREAVSAGLKNGNRERAQELQGLLDEKQPQAPSGTAGKIPAAEEYEFEGDIFYDAE